jgi:hypothetical protein
MTFSKKNITTIAVVILVLGAGAYFFVLNGKPADTISASSAPESEVEATFIGLASELDTVTFSGSIFTDVRFLGLKDIHTNIITELAGRHDPFAQLSGLKVSP